MHACLQGYDEDVRMILTLGKANADLKQASKYPYRGTRQGIRNKVSSISYSCSNLFDKITHTLSAIFAMV